MRVANNKSLQAASRGCILCGTKPPSFLGIFVPTDSFALRIGLAPGGRMIGYALCTGCRQLPDAMARVEQHILDTGEVLPQLPNA
jgi:hypothetical protein